MMSRMLLCLVMSVLILSACNLANAPATEAISTPTIMIASTNNMIASSVPPTAVAPTLAPIPNTDNTACVPRTDWPTYTIQPGDTLSAIVQISRAGYTVEQLAELNCLDDPNNLVVGQIIYVPNALKTGDLLRYWVNTPADLTTADSFVAACDATITPITSNIGETTDPAVNLPNRLHLLLQDEHSNWSKQGLSVQEAVVSNGQATIMLAGDFLFPGHCADGTLEAEMIFTIFEDPAITSAKVIVNSQNLRQIIDLSGLVGSDYVYTRAYLPPDF